MSRTGDGAESGESARFRVCRRFLLIWFIGQLAVGYSAALLIDTGAWGWHQDRVAAALWGSAEFGAHVAAYRAWVMGIFGPTLAAWAAVCVFVVWGPFRRRERWAWWAIAASILAWAPVDTAISLYHQVWINVAFNVGGTAAVGIPLALTWRDFARA